MRIRFRVAAILYAFGVYIAVAPANAFELTLTRNLVDQAAHVFYCPCTGNVSFISPNDPLQSMQIESASGLFRGWTWTKVPPWDVQTALKQTHFDFEGYADRDAFNLGPILPAGMTPQQVIAEIMVDGSRLAGGKIDSSPGGGPYLFWIPEPSSATLVCIGGVLCLSLRRRRNNKLVSNSFR